MDPTETLRQIREAIENWNPNDTDFKGGTDVEVAELFLALDEWLTKGGLLPEQWKGAR